MTFLQCIFRIVQKKMHYRHSIISFLLNICAINAAVLLWSNKKVEISPLLPFDDEDLELLVHKLDIEKVYRFKMVLRAKNSRVPQNLQEVINGFYSSYNPNGNIANAKSVELFLSEDCDGLDLLQITRTTGKLTNSTNFLCILDIRYPRVKRSVDGSLANVTANDYGGVPQGAVIYTGKSTKDNKYALLYSSRPLKLEVNKTIHHLAKADNTIVDTRLNIKFHLENQWAITLRFGIVWANSYWYVQTVKVEMNHPTINISRYDLSTDENIMAALHFSYHCNGQSIFIDKKTGTKLTIYDLQIQIAAKEERFGDANDCVPFFTIPIWSGIFVTAIMCIGLMISLSAIMDIKTMDKFDNHRTKNLSITVIE